MPARQEDVQIPHKCRWILRDYSGGNLLALRVVILDQVLEEVHSLLGLNLVDFDQVLRSKDRRAEVKQGGGGSRKT